MVKLKKSEHTTVEADAGGATAWRRASDDHEVNSRLGQRLRELREKAGISLSAASKKTGIPVPTLSRIETNKMAPTFGIVMKLMSGLNLNWSDINGPLGTKKITNEISISTPDDRAVAEIPGYRYSLLHEEVDPAHRFRPAMFEVLCRTLEESGGMVAHPGVEFFYVLSGTIEFHLEGQAPRLIKQGASMLFNSGIPHIYVGRGRKKVMVLNVVLSEPTVSGTDPGSTPTFPGSSPLPLRL